MVPSVCCIVVFFWMEVSRSHSTDSSMILFLWHYPNFGVVNAVWPPPSPHSKVLTLLRPIRLQAGQIIDVEVILSREGIRSIQIPNPPFFYAPWARHTIHITSFTSFTSIHINSHPHYTFHRNWTSGNGTTTQDKTFAGCAGKVDRGGGIC